MDGLQQQKEKLFDENFNCISNNLDELLAFCNILTEQSTILCCTKSGKMYEYLPQIYNSVVNSREMSNL